MGRVCDIRAWSLKMAPHAKRSNPLSEIGLVVGVTVEETQEFGKVQSNFNTD